MVLIIFFDIFLVVNTSCGRCCFSPGLLEIKGRKVGLEKETLNFSFYAYHIDSI
jgi:hypothetical protein